MRSVRGVGRARAVGLRDRLTRSRGLSALVVATVAFAGGLGFGSVALPAASVSSGSASRAASVPGQAVPADSVPLDAVPADAVPVEAVLRAAVPAPVLAAPVDPTALDAAGLTGPDRAAGLLSTEVPTHGSGTLVVVPGTTTAPGAGPVRTVRVEVEGGLPVDAALFAATVMETLNDPRGWGAGGAMTFARTDGDAELRVVLASPAMVDAMCAPLDTVGIYSCGVKGHAAINFLRWSGGAENFGADRTLYRQYVISHEVGHLLGYHHVTCPGPGQPAPIMQQQTGTRAPCLPSAFPHP
ncbi:MAG: DUF3152 domain-containing protein [Cellulomonas sp.]